MLVVVVRMFFKSKPNLYNAISGLPEFVLRISVAMRG